MGTGAGGSARAHSGHGPLHFLYRVLNDTANEFALVIVAVSAGIINELHELFADLFNTSDAFLALHSALRGETGNGVIHFHSIVLQSSCHIQDKIAAFFVV